MEPEGIEPPCTSRIARRSRESREARSARRSAVCTGGEGGSRSGAERWPIGRTGSPASRPVAAGGNTPVDLDLARLAAAWADLPPDVRAKIVAALDINR